MGSYTWEVIFPCDIVKLLIPPPTHISLFIALTCYMDNQTPGYKSWSSLPMAGHAYMLKKPYQQVCHENVQ